MTDYPKAVDRTGERRYTVSRRGGTVHGGGNQGRAWPAGAQADHSGGGGERRASPACGQPVQTGPWTRSGD